MPQMILTGDLNFMGVTDPTVPFRKTIEDFKAADVRFSNMECCLYAPPGGHALDNEGFFAAPGPAGESLKFAGIDAVGIANNVNYGEAAITSSIKRLDEIGIKHTGAGADRAAAYAPVIIEKNGVRYGFLQRTSVFWPTNHEATAHTAGVATLKGHTAYQVPSPKANPDFPPANRPGVPPEIITWPDAKHLQLFVETTHPEVGRFRSVRSPVSFDGERALEITAPPLLGEHNAQLGKGWPERPAGKAKAPGDLSVPSVHQSTGDKP